MSKNRIITVQDIPITVSEADIDDYICITDMATAKSDSSRAADVIKNWLRNRNTKTKRAILMRRLRSSVLPKQSFLLWTTMR